MYTWPPIGIWGGITKGIVSCERYDEPCDNMVSHGNTILGLARLMVMSVVGYEIWYIMGSSFGF